MHSSAIYKGYALYKIDGKNTLQQQNSTWCPFAANVFSEFLLLPFRDMLLIFLLYGFSKHVHISVLSLSLFVGLCVAFFCILYQSCSHLTGHTCCVFLSLSLILCISALLDTVKSNSKVSKESNTRERAGHEQDSNSQCDERVGVKKSYG